MVQKVMKILLLVERHYNKRCQGEQAFRKTLRDSADVFIYGKPYMKHEETMRIIPVSKIIEENGLGKIDVLMTSFCWDIYDGFNEVPAFKVNIAPDYYEGAWRMSKYDYHYSLHDYDISFGYSTAVVNYLRKNRVGRYQYHLPFSVDTSLYRKLNLPKKIDVAAFYTTETKDKNVYPWRIKIQEILGGMPYVVWLQIEFGEDCVNRYNQSKICVNSNRRFRFITPRVTEVMACGSFLLTDYNDDFRKYGFKDGEHLSLFHSLNDFKDKVRYWLEHDEEREEIASNGMEFVRSNFSNQRRVELLLKTIRKHL